MTGKIATTLICTIPGLALAQISVDFSSYSDGPLNDSPDWSVFNSAGPDPFTVSGGQLVVDPADTFTGFSGATYVGTGGILSSQYYQVDINFSLDFTNGTPSVRTGGSVMPQFELLTAWPETPVNAARFGIRHVEPFGGTGNVFNIYVGDNFNGSNNNLFSPGFFGTDIGLAVDGSDNWSDGQSKDLILSYTLTGDGANNWSHSLQLLDASDSSVISEIVNLAATDTDGSFSSLANQFRFYPESMQVEQQATLINSIDLTTVPEPSAFVLLAGLLALGTIAVRRRVKE